MPAEIRHPQSAFPDRWHTLKGYDSLEHLQKEMRQRYGKNAPPAYFDPKWMICPTIPKNTPNGVEMWKWNIDREAWLLDAEIIWKEGA